jgi:hypothetical protein
MNSGWATLLVETPQVLARALHHQFLRRQSSTFFRACFYRFRTELISEGERCQEMGAYCIDRPMLQRPGVLLSAAMVRRLSNRA